MSPEPGSATAAADRNGAAAPADAGGAAAGGAAAGSDGEGAAAGSPPAAEPSLRSRVIRGSALTAGLYGLGQMLRLASNLILTRLLLEEHFALMGMVFIALEGLELFSDIGIRPGIVYSPRGNDRAYLDTAWTIQVVRGIGLWLLACALGPVMGYVYADEYPELSYLLPIVGSVAFIGSLSSTKLYSLMKWMRPGRVLVAELGTQAAAVAVMVTIATIWRSYWALVIGGMTAPFLLMITSHFIIPGPTNRFHWDAGHARELFRYGRWVFVSTLFTFLARQSDRLILAKLISETVMGVYNIALIGVRMCVEVVSHVVEWVAFPAYSRKIGAGEPVGDAFRRATTLIVVGSGAMVAALIAAGPALIEFLYDARYERAGWMLRFLGFSAWFMVLEGCCSSLVKALGTTHWMAAGHAAKFFVLVVSLPLGFQLGGLEGGLIGIVVADVVRYGVAAVGLQRQGYPVLWNDLAMTVHLALSVLIGAGVDARLDPELFSLWRLVIVSAAAAAPWLLPAALFWRRNRAELS